MKKVDIYTIDTGVPVPEGNFAKMPLGELNVGESILFPIEKRRSVASRASIMKAKTGREFTIKKMDEATCRIWRVK